MKSYMSSIEINDLESIKTRIENLKKVHQIEILKLIKKYNFFINENNNGVFINITKMTKDCYDEINRFLTFVDNQEKSLSTVETLKSELAENFFSENKQHEDTV